MRKHSFKYCTYTHSINGFVFYVGHGTFNRPYEKGRSGKDSHRSHSCIAVFDNGSIKEFINIQELSDNIKCMNASAYARGALGNPKHYWKSGKCYIYYKEDYIK